ncbi:hypothetical protein FHG87_007814 [Trinorchestia longiramus]|nr:hypothetical protein FHG87_007814 [Trinorchestia longiramus]
MDQVTSSIAINKREARRRSKLLHPATSTPETPSAPPVTPAATVPSYEGGGEMHELPTLQREGGDKLPHQRREGELYELPTSPGCKQNILFKHNLETLQLSNCLSPSVTEQLSVSIGYRATVCHHRLPSNCLSPSVTEQLSVTIGYRATVCHHRLPSNCLSPSVTEQLSVTIGYTVSCMQFTPTQRTYRSVPQMQLIATSTSFLTTFPVATFLVLSRYKRSRGVRLHSTTAASPQTFRLEKHRHTRLCDPNPQQNVTEASYAHAKNCHIFLRPRTEL